MVSVFVCVSVYAFATSYMMDDSRLQGILGGKWVAHCVCVLKKILQKIG